MPKRGEKKVLPIGICTWPPWESAPNSLSASGSTDSATDVSDAWNRVQARKSRNVPPPLSVKARA